MHKFKEYFEFIGYILFIIYVFSMFIYPWFIHHGDWLTVQSVWDRWQTLNVGALAFISSVILYKATKLHAEEQRKRSFIAARAFLPEAFDELLKYLQNSSTLLQSSWNNLESKSSSYRGPISPGINVLTPSLPTDYKVIFKDCISYAEPNVGDYLAKFLVRLQVHDARLSCLKTDMEQGSLDQTNLKSYIYSLAEMVVYINKAFNYARGKSDFDDSPFSLNDFATAYLNMDINVEEFDDLWQSTERWISRLH